VIFFHRLFYCIKQLIAKIMGQYPLPAYHFIVDWGGTRTAFLEISGLNIMIDVTELRQGADTNQSARKAPGHIHYSNIILKRAIQRGDNEFFTWVATIKLNTVERRDIVIKLLNENHEPVISWKVINSFPVKLTGPVLNANANCVAIEEIELAHEGIFIEVI
jgi:phage tail-like protein